MDTTSEYFPLRARCSTSPEVPMVPLIPVLVINRAALELGMYKNIDICYRHIKISKKSDEILLSLYPIKSNLYAVNSQLLLQYISMYAL